MPSVVLTDVRLFGNPVEIGSHSPLQQSISYAKRLIFSHEQNVFSLSFAALSYSNPDTIRYRYRLEGLDHGWNEVGSDGRQVTYTTLPAGTYTFHVQAATTGRPVERAGNFVENRYPASILGNLVVQDGLHNFDAYVPVVRTPFTAAPDRQAVRHAARRARQRTHPHGARTS